MKNSKNILTDKELELVSADRLAA